jgi:hypothetical protein
MEQSLSDTHGGMRLISVEDPHPGQAGLPMVISSKVQSSPLKPQPPRRNVISIQYVTLSYIMIHTRLEVCDASNNRTVASVCLTIRDNLPTEEKLRLVRDKLSLVRKPGARTYSSLATPKKENQVSHHSRAVLKCPTHWLSKVIV